MTNFDSPASDTKPKAPAGLREAINTTQPKWNVPEPSRPGHLLGDDEPVPGRCLLSVLVLGMTTCLCTAVVGLSALAGYGDELDEIQTQEAKDREIAIGTQYALAVQNESQGAVELALDRYLFIETQQPGFGDVRPRLTQLALVLSATPTPTASPTASVTPTPTLEASPEASPTPKVPPAEEYFRSGQKFMDAGLYEEAIEWFNAVIGVDPAYRRTEVDVMLVEALKAQGYIYLRGLNLDDGSNGLPGNQLARGVQMIKDAERIWESQPAAIKDENLRYEADYVERVLNAQAYLAGGLNAEALPILQRLYEESSVWSYRGITIADLLIQAGGTPSS